MVKKATGSISIAKLDGAVVYVLRPNLFSLIFGGSGKFDNSGLITCEALVKLDNGSFESVTKTHTVYYAYEKTNGDSDEWIEYTGAFTPKDEVDYKRIKFRLFLKSASDVKPYDSPVAEAEIIVFDSRFIDTKFLIWIGEPGETPSEHTKPQSEWYPDYTLQYSHLGDYYISSEMRYYVFSFDDSRGFYWQEVTDEILKNILNRTLETTDGFFVTRIDDDKFKALEKKYENKGVDEPAFCAWFEYYSYKYHTGDVAWYNQRNPSSLDGGDMWIAWKDQSDGPKFSDWKLGSSLESRFNEAGISIKDKLSINVTADTLRFYNTESDEDNPVMLLSMGYDADGKAYPRINSEMLEINSNVKIDGNAEIHGWYIENGVLHHPSDGGYATNGMGISTQKERYAFWAGASDNVDSKDENGVIRTLNPYPFTVTREGKLTATDAVINGDITAKTLYSDNASIKGKIVATSLVLDNSIQIPFDRIDQSGLEAKLTELGYVPQEGGSVITPESFVYETTYYDKSWNKVSTYNDAVYIMVDVKLGGKTISSTIQPKNGNAVYTNVGLGEETGNYFKVETDGLLTANNAIIHGTIYANAGKIGGCDIDNGILTIPQANIQNLKTDMLELSEKIKVGENYLSKEGLFTGTVTADHIRSGNFGGDEGFKLFATDQENASAIFDGQSATRRDWRLLLGNKFGVTKDGLMYAKDAVVQGTIVATRGRIGNWEIKDGSITIDSTSVNGLEEYQTKTNERLDGVVTNVTNVGNKIDSVYNSVKNVEDRIGDRLTWIDEHGVYTGEVKAEHVSSYDTTSNTGFNLYSADLTNNTTVLNHTTNDWRFTVGLNFGIDKNGIAYAKDVQMCDKTEVVNASEIRFSQNYNIKNNTTNIVILGGRGLADVDQKYRIQLPSVKNVYDNKSITIINHSDKNIFITPNDDILDRRCFVTPCCNLSTSQTEYKNNIDLPYISNYETLTQDVINTRYSFVLPRYSTVEFKLCENITYQSDGTPSVTRNFDMWVLTSFTDGDYIKNRVISK